MRQHLTTVVMAGAAILLSGAGADAQWRFDQHPSRGVCFYEHANYEGRYFCAAVGRHASMVPSGANDQISAIRVFGSVEVKVFKDTDYRGESRRFTSSISNLEWTGWNDRISSYRVEDRDEGSYGGWGGAYGGGSWGGGTGGHHDGWGGAYGGGSHSSWSNRDGGRWTYQEAEAMLRRAYRSVLGREPDPGAHSWVDAVIKNNWSQAQLEADLRQTPEYRNKRR